MTAMQQGMLFQTLQLPGSGVCFEQDTYTVLGDVNTSRMASAWEQVVTRHSALRTSFLWGDIEEPHQVVHRQGVVDFRVEDWRGSSDGQQQDGLREYLVAERQRGFDLGKLPLIRFALFRLTDRLHQLVLNYHHAVLDGWSIPLVMNEVLSIYESLGTPVRPSPPPRPYSDFIAWLQQHDLTRAKAHWQRRLEGFKSTTSLMVDRRNVDDAPITDGTFKRMVHEVPSSVHHALISFSRKHRVTLGTLIQGAWALLLSRYSGSDDVVFGLNVAGRPPELAGVDAIVGLFINTLPLRVSVPSGIGLLPWLRSIQDQVLEVLEYDFSPLVQVQKWSELNGGQSLFDSIVVIENYPTIEKRSSGSGLDVKYQVRTKHSKTGYPLTLLAWPGEQLLLELKFDERRFDPSTIERMLGHVQAILEGMAANPNCSIDDVPLLPEYERIELIQAYDTSPKPVTSLRIPMDGVSHIA